MNTVQLIAKNTGALAVSQVINAILSFFMLIYIARYLGAVDFGKYSFAIAFTGLSAIIANFGLNNYIIREVARNKKFTKTYLTNVLALKLLLSGVTFWLIFIIINLLTYPKDTTIAVYIFGLYTILASFTMTFRSIIQAHERMVMDAFIVVIDKSVLVLLIFLVLFSGFGLIMVAYAFLFGGLFSAIFSFGIMARKITRPQLRIEYSFWKTLIIESLPFALNALFGVLFFQIDTVMLSVLKGDAAVGIYNAAYNPLLALGVIPSIFITAIYPVMSRYFVSSRDTLEIITVLTSKYMAILGFPIAIGCSVLANRFIFLFYSSQFSASTIAFQILAFFIPLRYVSTITGTLLTSINRQVIRTTSVGISALFNILLNALLIPYLSYIGACVATVLSEIFLYFIFIYYITKYYKRLKIHRLFIKPFFAALIMGLLVYYLKNLNFLLLIVLAAIVYFSLLVVLKTFNEVDLDLIRQVFKKND